MYGVQGSILTWVKKDVCILLIQVIQGLSDNEFLQHISGINDNSFIRVLDPDIDEDNELNCPQIISHSSYSPLMQNLMN